jgi:hypothetical protein
MYRQIQLKIWCSEFLLYLLFIPHVSETQPVRWLVTVWTTGVPFFATAADRLWGLHSLLFNGYRGSPPSSVEFKTMKNHTSTPPYAFIAWFLNKLRGRFSLSTSFVCFSDIFKISLYTAFDGKCRCELRFQVLTAASMKMNFLLGCCSV